MKTPQRWVAPWAILSLLVTGLAPAAPGPGFERTPQQQAPRQAQTPTRPVQPQRQTPQQPQRQTPQQPQRQTPQQPQRQIPQQPQRQVPQQPQRSTLRPTLPQRATPRVTPAPLRPREVTPSLPDRKTRLEPAPKVRPQPAPAIRDLPPQRPSTKPLMNRKPEISPGGKDQLSSRPERVPGSGDDRGEPRVKPAPGTKELQPGLAKRPPGSATGLDRTGGRPGKPARPVLARPADRLTTASQQATPLDPAQQKKWGSWGKWDRVPHAKSANVALISPNYQRSLNWSYRPNCWGARPWWTASACHGWHRGHWNYGWGSSWYRYHHCYYPPVYPGYVSPVAWGLAAWGLGSLIYDSGYYVYSNPYPVLPYRYGATIIAYDRPFSSVAADFPTGDEDASALAATRSTEALERSRAAFFTEDYLAALKSADEAISHQPGDSALHEYRALILFALGKYSDAAGVLNPVLASGPGWDRATMVGLYRAEDSYLDQLAKLDQYAAATPNQPAARFLLGYHYLVGGDLERSFREFDEVTRLQPADGIARQLRDLAKSSINSPDAPPPPADDALEEPAVEALTANQLVGTWNSNRGENGIVTLALRDDRSFTWSFRKGEQANDLTGTYEIDDRGLLVLTTEDAQMVGEVTLPAEAKMTFILAGGPEGDPGLTFDRAP